VAFFAQSQPNNATKFVTLNRAETRNAFRPYDLEVVPQLKAAPEHFTMSANGIVHLQPGQFAHVETVSDWMRESSQFNVLRTVGTFKNHLTRKCFESWRENVRFRLYCAQRKKLASRLFLGMKSFCAPLLEVKRAALEMESTQVIEVANGRDNSSIEVATFVELQAGKRAEATKEFETAMEAMAATVTRVCSAVRNLARQQAVHETLEYEYENGGNTHNKSIVALKQEAAERRALVARSESEARLLTELIRMVDYVAVGHLVELVLSALERFLAVLKPEQARKVGLFQTDMLFCPGGTNFSPCKEEMLGMVQQLVDQTINTCSTVSRIIFTEPFEAVMEAVITEGPSVAQIIRESPRYARALAAINEKIATDFEQADKVVLVFDDVRPVWDYDQTWDLEAYRAKEHTVESLSADLAMLTDWSVKLESMRGGNACGMLHVDSKNTKALLMPMNISKLEKVTGVLADAFGKRTKEIVADYKARMAKMANRPAKFDQFAAHMEHLRKMKEELDLVREQTAEVEGMYALLQEHGVYIRDKDAVEFDEMREQAAAYEDEAKEADNYVDTSKPEMSKVLAQTVVRLIEQIQNVSKQVSEGIFVDDTHIDEPAIVVAEIDELHHKLENYTKLAAEYNSIEGLFKVDVTKFNDLEEAQKHFDATSKLWKTADAWKVKKTYWLTENFTTVQWEEEAKEVQIFFKDAFSLAKKMPNPVTEDLKMQVSEFKSKIPTIQELGNPNMRARHWEKVYSAMGKGYCDEIQLETLLEWGVMDHSEVISEQSATSSGEAQLEDSLADIENNWTDLKFITISYRDSETVFILGGLDDIYLALEDNQVTLQTMMGSRFIMGVREAVEIWDKKLALLSETLDEWIACQRQWMYLETIFSADDIQKQLPVEAQKFKIVDKTWKTIMKTTNEEPLVIKCLDIEPSLLPTFQACNESLDQIQKSLEEFLETKRLAFARFFFLSNDELLEILSQTRDPHAVQPFMVKCFDAIKSIKFDEEPGCETHVLGMKDPMGEYCPFTEFSKAEGAVEDWLTDIEGNMRSSLFDLAKKSYLEYPSAEMDEAAIERTDWFWKWPAAVTIVVDEIYWTNNLFVTLKAMEDGSNPKGMVEFLDFTIRQIDRMVQVVRGPLDNLQRTMMGALLTIDVHARDVQKAMVKQGVSSTIDFNWTKQLRYYWDKAKDNCTCCQTNAVFDYCYEFLGNSFRLVITPLTDLCYMTLTGALHLKLGGAPAGPAGTGKTETTKDLGKAIAVQCVVFNCSDGLDYKIMGRFFKGLAMAGAWACFDEFNRIDIEVLSVIAQQIMCIQQAIIKHLDVFEFEGSTLPLGKMFGVFITMNPGYAGRTELPDNLKALFRPVAMMVPDYRMIAEIVLFSQGFANALPLSNKMSQLYALSSEQLSKQDHYDFGMRAVKTVLVAAGLLKRKEPETFEDLLLIRAMRDSNVPKFLSHDLPLFFGILDDLFPGTVVPFVDYGELQAAIENQIVLGKLQVVKTFVSKVIQVHETQLVRHGMMVVGEAASGKTTNVMILAKALSQLCRDGVKDRDGFYKVVDRLILNPKSISAGELFGSFNLMTGEWADGIVPKLFRQSVSKAEAGSDDRSWILFDGPVDAVWIENMNTVLDDNRQPLRHGLHGAGAHRRELVGGDVGAR
jgi:dynein heavy chain